MVHAIVVGLTVSIGGIAIGLIAVERLWMKRRDAGRSSFGMWTRVRRPGSRSHLRLAGRT